MIFFGFGISITMKIKGKIQQNNLRSLPENSFIASAAKHLKQAGFVIASLAKQSHP